MPDTFVKIASVTVGSGGASSMSFSSIPATYTDLVVKVSARGTASAIASNIYIGFNSSTASFSAKGLGGDGATAGSYGSTVPRFIGNANAATATATTFSNVEFYIPNYASSNYKSVSSDSVTENNATTAYADIVASLWSNTAAITSIDLTLSSGNFAQYSTATLYGIKNS